MKYKKILVPYDGSKFSQNALRHAMDLAKTSKDSKLFLLHIIQEISLPPSFDYGVHISEKTSREYIKEIYYNMKISALKMLEVKKNDCEKERIDCKINTALGNTADKIIEFAKEKEIDLVVIGSKGLGGISRIMAIGSVARKVSEHSPCPVLLIH